MLVCSIELMNGKAVQLKQGFEKVIERSDVLDIAKYFGKFGELEVIDIDASIGNGNNEKLIEQICKIADCRVGGGIRTTDKANRILGFGAKKIIIGSATNEAFLSRLPKDKVLIAIDTKDGVIATNAWTRTLSATPADYIKKFSNYCSGFTYKNINKTGTLSGIDFDIVSNLKKLTPKELTVAGGICSIEEIQKLEKMSISPHIGMALYNRQINIVETFVNCIDFEKRYGYIPTIVQDATTSQVLSLCYSSKESLTKTLTTGKGTYINRDDKKIFVKGDVSGNTQELVNAKYNCDLDAILFKVIQKGNACHLGKFSCFESKVNSINNVFNKILENKRLMPDDAETTILFNNEYKIKKLLMQKAFDIVNFDKTQGLTKESADFIYYLLVYLAHHNTNPNDIINALNTKN